MLISDGGYYFQCDVCGTQSDKYASVAELLAGTNFGSSLYVDNPGWVHGRGQLQLGGDDSILWSDQFKWHRGAINSNQHVCPACRGLFSMYEQ